MFFACFYLQNLSSKQGSNVSQEPLLLHPFIPQALSTGITFRLWNFFQQKSIRISWNRRRSANLGKMSELRYLNREPSNFFLPEIVILALIEAREALGDLLQVRIYKPTHFWFIKWFLIILYLRKTKEKSSFYLLSCLQTGAKLPGCHKKLIFIQYIIILYDICQKIWDLKKKYKFETLIISL